ncbi:L-piperidine-6-carboxylate dehydrogenase [Sediminitomix flava]|uniref:aldehyde dehydrogenase (NAD(+)) n=1 Tax=Sediminitomix flava TaxID=379075 RepID=A0A316A435_SEDFL|nr:aldehyde dehydrogenase family protein [Sediminitomix flava]PWJ44497.1 aldehyde dehydrogenase (NAD+) [Sediminitomix flava]
MKEVLKTLGIQDVNPAYATGLEWAELGGREIREIYSPVNGELIAKVEMATKKDLETVIEVGQAAFKEWRKLPAPKRGEIIRQVGEELRKYKDPLGKLVTYEMGKIYQEGLGEVQEMIDICDFAVGQSRQLYGLQMHSERPEHRMFEQYHPIGIVGIISAFNFPVAVWAWNAMLAGICGDVCIWKPSEKTPLTAIACQNILKDVLRKNGLPEGIFNLVIGDGEVGSAMSHDKRIPLVSATGSTRMGKKVGEAVGARLGKSLLELGGNNAVIISEHADLEMAIRATVFGAVGTCGQRCTSTRRLIIHENVYEEVKNRLVSVYPKLPIGNPLDESKLVGPLIDQDAVDNFKNALSNVSEEGGNVLVGGEVLTGEGYESGFYVTPAIVEAKNEYEMVQEETFAPILYLIKYSGDIENAIEIQNGVKQGLSSAVFTLNVRESERFLAAAGSDCGIANVNIGTSGAEIGGAFGGEKETGGGRESGSDAWKVYMRRQTNTLNYSTELPLAQGIKFDI